jgi:GNAT superfamily N-acetyltransferase
MNTVFTIHLAGLNEDRTVIRLIEKAADWLRGQGTDQWATPWPTLDERDERVRIGLERRQTWLVCDGHAPVATMTVCQDPIPHVWQERDPGDAVYVHRLVIDRRYAGQNLGGMMIDWAVQRELKRRRVEWVRVDVWTKNEGLHAYYERQGFVRCGTCPDDDYPSGALFQKAADAALNTDTSHLVEK